MTVFNNTLLLAGAAEPAVASQISRSLRFNSLDSAYLSRTFGTPTTQSIFTFSAWVKRANLGTIQQLYGVSTNHSFGFTAADALNLTFGGVSALTTTAVFRDPSAWYHIVWTQNGTSHTLYVNNTSVGTATATSSVFNTAVAHQIAAANTTSYFNGYLTEIYFIDGQALTPSSFGKSDEVTGQWVPVAYVGTYGANGFKLNFSNNSAATSTTLGKDQAGSNNWTPNNLSVTAGAGNDSLVDSPSSYGTDTGVGGEVRGSYCILSPVATPTTFNSYGRAIAQNGGLELTESSGRTGTGTIAMTSGKWYAEVVFAVAITSTVNNYPLCGVCRADYDSSSLATFPGYDADGIGIDYTGQVRNQGTITTTYTAFSSTAIGMIAYDASTGKVWFGRNGTWFASGNPAAGTNPIATATWFASGAYFCCNSFSTSRAVWNFGQRPFSYTAPSGFKALCDTNLPAPVIAKPSIVMDAVMYTGTGAALTPTSSLGFSPDLVWIKARSGVGSEHTLYDILRGAQTRLEPSTTIVEPASDNGLTAFNSSGFTLGTLAQVNTNTTTYVAWCWDFGSANTVNTQGTISSTIRANTSVGSAIATYTGTGANATVGHGLGIAPSLIIIKRRNTAVSNWQVRHSSVAAASSIQLNLTNPAAAAATVWNSTAPTSTVFSVGTDASVNASGGLYVAYCFAAVSGYSSFGGYTGNLSLDGPFVYTGFRPRWVMIKQTTAASATGWVIVDSARLGYNVDNNPLFANSNAIEATTDLLDITSTGFKIRSTDASVNASAGTYIYAAFAESPFQYSRAR